MIRKMYVDNYKCLVNFDLQLDEVSLLFGASGVGKTSVFDVVFALRRLLAGESKISDVEAFPTETLTRWQDRDIQVFEILLELESERFQYRLEVDHERSTRRARIRVERLLVNGRPLFECNEGDVQLFRDDHSEGPKYHVDWAESALARVASRNDNTRLTMFRDHMINVVVCSPIPALFRTESTTETPLLRRDARNFPDWYRHGVQENPDQLVDYVGILRECIEGFSGIRLERVGHEARSLVVTFLDPTDDNPRKRYELRFDEISDGQRVLAVLYALIHLTREQGYTLFIDEPDNYVALSEIQPWLMSLEENCGDAIHQVILSSHHPELINHLGRDCGILLELEASGAVKTRRPETLDDKGLGLSDVIARGWEK